METSNLNDHMVKRYLQDNPSCDCGAQAETPLLSCPKFTKECTIMLNNLPNTTLPINVDILLCGHPELKEYENQQLFEAVINLL